MSEVTNLFVEKLYTELSRVASGTSSFVNGAITFEMTKLPFAQLLNRFKADPDNKELLKMLPAAALQDFGQRFSDFVKGCVDDVRRAQGESVPLPVTPAPTSAFSQALYNQLSTILQYTIGRQLDAKQIERLQFDTHRLADALTKQIEERAAAKAAEICKVLAKVLSEEIESVKETVVKIDCGLQGNHNEIEELRADMNLPIRRND